VGFLDSFERQVERLVGGAFAKTFTSGVHPVEIVAALKKEMDSSARPVTRTRVLAPHSFHVGLSSVDQKRLGQLGPGFVTEIQQSLEEYRKVRGYSCSEPLVIALEEKLTLAEGMVEVHSDSPGSVVWVPTITWKSVRYPLTRASTIIGRGTDSDIHVVATGVSRHHAEIRWNGKRSEVVDLGSTNGTTLEGTKVTRAALPDSCTLGVGQARILFEVVPLQSAAYDALAHTPLTSPEETS
jgi:TusA-related sulfurtransferase